MPIDRDFLEENGKAAYLPVTVTQIDRARRLAVVALPVEADSGAHQIWVQLDQLKDCEEVSARSSRTEKSALPLSVA
jgi:hypothetical protein